MRFVAHAAALASAVLLAHAAQQQQQQPLLAPPPHAAAPATRVPLRIGLMSKCPDFFAFASTFSRVVDEPGVWRLIDVDYAYIAERARAGPVCKHGASECDGNVQELCVAHVSRALLGEERGQEQAWAFIDCLNYEGGASIGPDAVAQKCLRATKGVHWQDDGVEACVHGHMGRELLEKSAERAERSGIKLSATLQIEGQTVCVRDSGAWKDCSIGSTPKDWVRAIEAAWQKRNPGSPLPRHPATAASEPLRRPSPVLHKRQSVPSATNTLAGGGTAQRATPLSVFTFVIAAVERKSWWRGPGSGRALQRRQFPGSSGTGLSGPTLPMPFLVFGIAAIALFVLVVAFVLLRIFVRNRRLRRMGLLPEGGPMDRYFGGAMAPQEDTLVPPKLWEAKIVDVRAVGSKQAERSAIGGGIGAGDVKTHGWDALMPVSAALPPALYSTIVDKSGDKDAAAAPAFSPPSYPPPPNGPEAAPRRPGLTHRIPGIFRRHTGEDGENSSQQNAAASGSAAAPATADETARSSTERLPVSVNVTVLIAMPSPRTVFPSRRSAPRAAATTSALRSAGSQSFAAGGMGAAVVELDETDADDDGGKGKRRAPGRPASIRSVGSSKSVAEARREAYFGELQASTVDADVENVRGDNAEEEEEELPELVFGTASVPLYTRDSSLARANSLARRGVSSGAYLPTPASELVHPHRRELAELLRSAVEAHKRKDRPEAPKRESTLTTKGTEGAALAGASNPPRVSTADTSIDASRVGDDTGDISRAAPLDDVVTRMMRHDAGEPATRPSLTQSTRSGLDSSLDMSRAGADTSLSGIGLLSDEQQRQMHLADADAAPVRQPHPLAESTTAASLAAPSSQSLSRSSTNTWHTGASAIRPEEDDAARDEAEAADAARRLHAALPA